MFIQEVYDDVSKKMRAPFKLLIGFPVTVFVIMVLAIMIPFFGILFLIHRPLEFFFDSIAFVFRVIFFDVKKCKRCDTYEKFDRFGKKYCKCIHILL